MGQAQSFLPQLISVFLFPSQQRPLKSPRLVPEVLASLLLSSTCQMLSPLVTPNPFQAKNWDLEDSVNIAGVMCFLGTITENGKEKKNLSSSFKCDSITRINVAQWASDQTQLVGVLI